MGMAIYGNIHEASFKKDTGFSYNNSTGTDPQSVTNWSITQSSDAINPLRDQMLITAHDRASDTLLMHVKDADFISRQPGGTMHQRTINDFLSSQTRFVRNNLTFITGGSNRNGQVLGISGTINCSNDGYHYPNFDAADVRQTSSEEMKMLNFLYKQRPKHGTFEPVSYPQSGDPYHFDFTHLFNRETGTLTVSGAGAKQMSTKAKQVKKARTATKSVKRARKARAARIAKFKHGCTGAIIGGVSAYVGIRSCQYVMDVRDEKKLTTFETVATVGTCAVGGACAMVSAPAVATGVAIAAVAVTFGAGVQWLKTKWWFY